MHRLKLQAPEKQKHVENGRGSGNVLFKIALNRASYIGNAEGQPVKEKDGQAGMIFRKGMALRAIDAKKSIEPVQMSEIGGKNPEHFQFEPAHLQNNGYQANRKENTCGETVNAILTEPDRKIAKQESKAGDELRAITKGMKRHGHGNQQHQRAIHGQPFEVSRKNTHRTDVIHPVCAKEQQCPATPDPGAAKEAIALTLFERNTANEKKNGSEV